MGYGVRVGDAVKYCTGCQKRIWAKAYRTCVACRSKANKAWKKAYRRR